MHRRMKIKASPNICIGAKKSNVCQPLKKTISLTKHGADTFTKDTRLLNKSSPVAAPEINIKVKESDSLTCVEPDKTDPTKEILHTNDPPLTDSDNKLAHNEKKENLSVQIQSALENKVTKCVTFKKPLAAIEVPKSMFMTNKVFSKPASIPKTQMTSIPEITSGQESMGQKVGPELKCASVTEKETVDLTLSDDADKIIAPVTNNKILENKLVNDKEINNCVHITPLVTSNCSSINVHASLVKTSIDKNYSVSLQATGSETSNCTLIASREASEDARSTNSEHLKIEENHLKLPLKPTEVTPENTLHSVKDTSEHASISNKNNLQHSLLVNNCASEYLTKSENETLKSKLNSNEKTTATNSISDKKTEENDLIINRDNSTIKHSSNGQQNKNSNLGSLLRPLSRKKKFNVVINNRRAHFKGQPIVHANASKRAKDSSKAVLVTEEKQTIDDVQSLNLESNKFENKLLEGTNKSMDTNKTKPNLNVILSKKSKEDSKENFNEINVDVGLLVPRNKSSIKMNEKVSFEPPTKKVFNERKQIYKKKLLEGKLEHKKITMFDLIFWNPSTNPMPGNEENEKKQHNGSAVIESENTTPEIHEEERAEEEGLEDIENGDVIITEVKPATNQNEEIQDEREDEEKEEEESSPVLAPQVKIGPDGELIIDEQSLTIKTTAAKNRDEILKHAEVVEESNDTSHYGKWSKKRKRSTEWTKKETARFYKALSTVGTDFSLMATVFAWRSRAELKIKFKKEERVNRHLIDRALNDCTQFDFTIFDESDYDPDEDRKAAKEAEKVEAKKKKEIERQNRQALKEKEKKRKINQKNADKVRKRKLREVFQKRKRKKNGGDIFKNDNLLSTIEDSNESTALSVIIDPQEVICEVVFATKRDAGNPDIRTENEENFTTSANLSQVQDILPSAASPSSLVLKNISLSDEVKSIISAHPSPPCQDIATSYETVAISPCVQNSESVQSKISELLKDDVSTKIPSSQNLDTVTHLCLSSSSNILPNSKENKFIEIAMDSSKECIVDQAGSLIYKQPTGQSDDYTEISSSLNLNMQSSCSPIEARESATIASSVDDLSESSHPELTDQTNQSVLLDGAQYFFPITSVQKTAEGLQFIEMKTTKGLKKVPVPPFGPQITDIVVMASPVPEDPTEHIFHVYFVSPLSASNEIPTNDSVQLPSDKNPDPV